MFINLGLFAELQRVVEFPESLSSQTTYLNSKFLLHLPVTKKSNQKWPLIVFLHGRGERGDNIEKVKSHGPPKVVEKDKNFPFMVLSPQCLKGKDGKGWWKTKDLDLLLDYVKKTYPVDEQRIYLTGLSMGGFGTWAWAAERPTEFAAIAPICGGGNPLNAKRLSKLPIWVFHGDKDKVVPITLSQLMVTALKAEGAKVDFTIYPNVGHNSWSKTYANPKLYEWFMEHKKE
ncbi:phospholipase/Carboxylesterase [Lentisphaera araneosa HTCC2155]|uniref:Phospholipase/Carboxylesterase n=2 Tax=Lentisphaera TaxID=256846 RepID=A6DKD0_9BACT|nr:phospholipase/Carboxylesterase [Lentisphaera araneosa HTCC2155]